MSENEHTYPPEFVYFIQAEHGGPIKIGKAVDPGSRLKQIQTHNAERVVIRRVIETRVGFLLEEQLHSLFSSVRYRGEWFRPHPALAGLCDGVADEALASVPLVYPEGRVSTRLMFALNNPDEWQQVLERDTERARAAAERRAWEDKVLRASDFPITMRPEDFVGDWNDNKRHWKSN